MTTNMQKVLSDCDVSVMTQGLQAVVSSRSDAPSPPSFLAVLLRFSPHSCEQLIVSALFVSVIRSVPSHTFHVPLSSLIIPFLLPVSSSSSHFVIMIAAINRAFPRIPSKFPRFQSRFVIFHLPFSCRPNRKICDLSFIFSRLISNA